MHFNELGRFRQKIIVFYVLPWSNVKCVMLDVIRVRVQLVCNISAVFMIWHIAMMMTIMILINQRAECGPDAGSVSQHTGAYRRIRAALRKSADMSARLRPRRLHKVSQTFVLRNRSI